MILGLPLPPAILQPPIPIAPSHVEDFSLSRLGSSHSLSRARFFFPPTVSLVLPSPRSTSSPVASYIELPPRTPPFRANSKAIRMASGTTYTKTKNFFVARTRHARPLFCPGLYRSCLFVRGRAFSRRPATSFVLLYFVHRLLLYCLSSSRYLRGRCHVR